MAQLPLQAKSLGDRIARLRKMQNWTQDELGEKLGMHPTHISRLENDRFRPKAETLARVAEVLGVTLDELLDKQEDQPKIHDPQLLRTIQQVQELDQEDRMVVVRVVQALVAKKRMEQAINLA